MSPDATGILSKLGIKTVGTWTTAYSAVDEMIPYDSESLVQNFSRLPDDSLVGSAGRAPSSQGVQTSAGQTIHRLDYNNFDNLLELFFGGLAGRVLTFDETMATWNALQTYIEIEKQVTRWRFGPCKLQKIVLAGEKDGLVMLTCDWVVYDLNKSGTAFPAISVGGARNLVRFEDLQFRIDTIAGGPPAAGDTMRISSFELELDRTLVVDDYASKSQTAGQEKLVLEPIPNGFRGASLKITRPRYSTDADLFTWKDADTPIQAVLLFTRSAETLTIDLPDLRITEGPDAPVSGPERIEMGSTTFEVNKPAAGNPLYAGNECRMTLT